jgi:hypothetical protein
MKHQRLLSARKRDTAILACTMMIHDGTAPISHAVFKIIKMPVHETSTPRLPTNSLGLQKRAGPA